MKNRNQNEIDEIIKERETYSFSEKSGMVFFEYLSNAFMLAGFIALFSIYFTDITLIQTTCLFIIGYILKPSDIDHNRLVIKGVTEDIANIRLNTVIIRKKYEND